MLVRRESIAAAMPHPSAPNSEPMVDTSLVSGANGEVMEKSAASGMHASFVSMIPVTGRRINQYVYQGGDEYAERAPMVASIRITQVQRTSRWSLQSTHARHHTIASPMIT